MLSYKQYAMTWFYKPYPRPRFDLINLILDLDLSHKPYPIPRIKPTNLILGLEFNLQTFSLYLDLNLPTLSYT